MSMDTSMLDKGQCTPPPCASVNAEGVEEGPAGGPDAVPGGLTSGGERAAGEREPRYEPDIASSSHIQRDLLLLQGGGGRVCASLPRPHDARCKRGSAAEETRVTTMCAVTRGARQGNGRTRRGEGQGVDRAGAERRATRASSHLADLTRSLSRPPRREGAPALSSLALSLFSLSVRRPEWQEIPG